MSGGIPATFDLRVRFYELDPYGHVNHATYLQYFEAARVAWLGEAGQGLDRLQASNVNLVVTTVATRFLRPALLDQQLVIETAVIEVQRVRAQWAQVASYDGHVLAAQRINFATVTSVGRPTRMPAGLGEAMAQLHVDPSWHDRDLPDLAL